MRAELTELGKLHLGGSGESNPKTERNGMEKHRG